jgi:hypothetical protein
MATKTCEECGVAQKRPGHPKWCDECELAKQPVEVRTLRAYRRLARIPEELRRSRVPEEEWPPGRRWCAACQSFPRLEDTYQARCKTCASMAAYGGHALRTYGITPEEYAQLLKHQGGRCAVCRQRPRSRRLAIDHDHETGEVRGLLCSPEGYSCNRDVLGTLEGKGDALVLARRLVAYLESSPARALWGDEVPVQPEVR